jgi:CYTH domain-containing protein
MATNDREIERKYLLRAMPVGVVATRVCEIDQGYLPGNRIRERIRRIQQPEAARFVRTIKMGAGIDRFELEEDTTEQFFSAVWPLTRGRRVHKRRHFLNDGPVEWVVDEFLDRELVLAEIELERVDQTVTLPAWLTNVLVREVTDEPAMTNFSLAR